MNLNFSTFGKQSVSIFLNGNEIFAKDIDIWDGNMTIEFPSALIKNGNNLLEFHFPDARQPGNGDNRLLALAIKSFQIK